jgi:hypothetical protein
MAVKIILRVLGVIILVAVVYGLIVGPSGIGGSHPAPKHDKAKLQMEGLQTYYVESDSFKTQLQQTPRLDNATFVSITQLDPSVYKRNDKGEVLDPWGLPYVISRNNGQITITSPGLEQYSKLSSFQKWWSNE